MEFVFFFFFFQAEDGIRDKLVTGVQTCALPISRREQVDLRHELAQAERDALHLAPSLGCQRAGRVVAVGARVRLPVLGDRVTDYEQAHGGGPQAGLRTRSTSAAGSPSMVRGRRTIGMKGGCGSDPSPAAPRATRCSAAPQRTAASAAAPARPPLVPPGGR